MARSSYEQIVVPTAYRDYLGKEVCFEITPRLPAHIWGTCNSSDEQKLIRVRSGMSAKKTVHTMGHEAAHALDCKWNEKACDSLGWLMARMVCGVYHLEPRDG